MSSSGQDGALLDTLQRSVLSLGRGFDVTSDTRLLYCKGAPGSTLVGIDELNTRDLKPGLSNVSVDIDIVEEVSGRRTTPVMSFLEMSEYFNKKSELDGHIPLGSFNSMFNFTGPWKIDAATTKSLGMDGFFIPLYKVKLTSELILKEDIQKSIPHTWEPQSLSSFIENFGTHIITSVTIGGQDVVYVKQHNSSLLSEIDIEKYVKDIGDQRFTDPDSLLSLSPLRSKAAPSSMARVVDMLEGRLPIEKPPETDMVIVDLLGVGIRDDDLYPQPHPHPHSPQLQHPHPHSPQLQHRSRIRRNCSSRNRLHPYTH